jgi:NTE family protein
MAVGWRDDGEQTAVLKRLNLALQGGGAHGAYTWGVLDRLLEDERLEIEAISGSSAGAMNAIVVAEGLVEGGRQRARERLAEFWRAVSEEAISNPINNSFWDMFFPSWGLAHNPMLAFYETVTQYVSPYQFNPLNINPLRDLVLRKVNFERVAGCKLMQLFISATNVQTGRVKIFTGEEITIDVVMASACLPFLFQAVEIDGVPYWDGGYAGNPVLTPFLEHCVACDVLLVPLNPFFRAETPKTAHDIANRLNEITFNDPLLKELEHVDFVNRCVRSNRLEGLGYREVFLHRVGTGTELDNLTADSKIDPNWPMLVDLRDRGRSAADVWLTVHFDSIGRASSWDVATIFGFTPTRAGHAG